MPALSSAKRKKAVGTEWCEKLMRQVDFPQRFFHVGTTFFCDADCDTESKAITGGR